MYFLVGLGQFNNTMDLSGSWLFPTYNFFFSVVILPNIRRLILATKKRISATFSLAYILPLLFICYPLFCGCTDTVVDLEWYIFSVFSGVTTNCSASPCNSLAFKSNFASFTVLASSSVSGTHLWHYFLVLECQMVWSCQQSCWLQIANCPAWLNVQQTWPWFYWKKAPMLPLHLSMARSAAGRTNC